MEEASTPPSQLNLRKILFESNQIIKLQPRNFFFLALVFLLPSAFIIIYLLYQYPFSILNFLLNISNSTYSFGPDQDHIIPNIIPTSKTFLLPLASALCILLFSLCAIGSITFTTFHTFHGQPIKLRSAIMSIATSFFPLLGTILIAQAIISAIIVVLAVILFSVINSARSLGFQIAVFSPYFLAFCMAMAILFVLMVIHLHVNWALAPVIVVAESTWGFESLKRSASLIKGRRRLLLFLSYVLGFPQAVMVLVTCNSWITMGLNGVTLRDVSNYFILLLAAQVLMMSTSLTLSQLLGMVVNTVLYVYCQAIHDGEEFPVPGEYVRLPVQDKRVGSTKVSSVPFIVIATATILIALLVLSN